MLSIFTKERWRGYVKLIMECNLSLEKREKIMERKTTLVICAMEEEERAVLECLNWDLKREEITVSKQHDCTVTKISLEEKDILISLSGMGNLLAGVNIALITSKFGVDEIFLLGVGGALTSELDIGDLVISKNVAQHDYLSSLDDGNFRMKPGSLLLSKEDAKKHNPLIAADLNLIKRCQKVVHEKKTFVANMVSGNEFVGTSERKRELSSLFKDTYLVDMEAAAVAFLSEKLGIKFVVAKTVADRLLPDHSIETDFSKFLEYAAKNAAHVMKQVIINQ
jgi:adenosylhomocysteine nucleosidase